MREPIRFDDRVALVTGSGRGLGAACARALAVRGAFVIVHDAGVAPDGSGGDPSEAAAVADEIRHAGGIIAVSAENLEGRDGCRRVVQEAVDRYGRLDIVVQNARLLVWDPIEGASSSWERMRRVNVDAPFHITRAALPIMKNQGYGRFVFTTSGRAMAREWTREGHVTYAVGKMAHFGLMIVTAVEGAEHGVSANAISPAAPTRMLRQEVRLSELDPVQVAPGVVFLASDQCPFSGVVLEAPGGKFSVARWVSSDTIDFGSEPVDPETLSERWADIEGGLG